MPGILGPTRQARQPRQSLLVINATSSSQTACQTSLQFSSCPPPAIPSLHAAHRASAWRQAFACTGKSSCTNKRSPLHSFERVGNLFGRQLMQTSSYHTKGASWHHEVIQECLVLSHNGCLPQDSDALYAPWPGSLMFPGCCPCFVAVTPASSNSFRSIRIQKYS